MAVVKGMLMQSKGKKGIVMTSAGEFINVILPNENVSLGEEIEAVKYRQRKPLYYIVAVAAVFLMVLLIPGYQHFYSSEAMAYVALDINPSIELAVNKELKISAVEGLNSDGKKIVSEIDVTGIQLYQALPLLVKQAITDGYIESGRENVVLSTVTINNNNNEETIKIEETKLQQAINKPIQDQQLAAKVVIEHSDSAERDQAKKAGLSTGKYLIYKEAQKQGVNLTVDEIRKHGIYQLEQEKKLKVEQLLQKQPLVKMIEHQLPPGQSKKLQQDQHITSKQIEQLRKQLQRLPVEPEKNQQQLKEILHNYWTSEQEVRNYNKIQIIEREVKEHTKELDINSKQIQERQPELESKMPQSKNSEQWQPPGLEKKLESQQVQTKLEKLGLDKNNDDQHKDKQKNNEN